MAGGDEPIASELAALFEKAGMKVTRKIVKQIRLKEKILLIDCCESRNYHPEDRPCPIKNNDAHGDGDDGCNLGCDLIGKGIPKDCPLEDTP